ncbi:MAG: hypothetical protein QOD49_726, partial [Actinomycetota bacterium]|nr:hypothetical protein [Actinomycetota bacterium]
LLEEVLMVGLLDPQDVVDVVVPQVAEVRRIGTTPFKL